MGDADLDWRPIEPKDAAAWSATLIEIQHADRDWEFLTEQDLLDDFGNPDHDFPRGSMGAFSDGTMAAFGTVRVRSEADPVHEMRYWGACIRPGGSAASAPGCSTGPRTPPSGCTRSTSQASRYPCPAPASRTIPMGAPCTRRAGTSRCAGST